MCCCCKAMIMVWRKPFNIYSNTLGLNIKVTLLIILWITFSTNKFLTCFLFKFYSTTITSLQSNVCFYIIIIYSVPQITSKNKTNKQNRKQFSLTIIYYYWTTSPIKWRFRIYVRSKKLMLHKIRAQSVWYW